MEITIIKNGAMIVRRSPQCRAFTRAVIYEKSLSLLFPVGGAVVTNDWCITDKRFMEPNLCSDFWSMLHTFLDSLSFQTFVLMQCIRLSLRDTINKLEIGSITIIWVFLCINISNMRQFPLWYNYVVRR